MALQLIPPNLDLDFVGKRKFFVALSSVVNLVALLLLIFVGLNYGVDFAGGSVVQVRFKTQVMPNLIRDALAPLNLKDVTVQDLGHSGREYLLRFEKIENMGSIGAPRRLQRGDRRHFVYGHIYRDTL